MSFIWLCAKIIVRERERRRGTSHRLKEVRVRKHSEIPYLSIRVSTSPYSFDSNDWMEGLRSERKVTAAGARTPTMDESQPSRKVGRGIREQGRKTLAPRLMSLEGADES